MDNDTLKIAARAAVGPLVEITGDPATVDVVDGQVVLRFEPFPLDAYGYCPGPWQASIPLGSSSTSTLLPPDVEYRWERPQDTGPDPGDYFDGYLAVNAAVVAALKAVDAWLVGEIDALTEGLYQ